MKKQITHISLHQTAKVFALMMFLFSFIFFIPWAIILMAQGDREGSLIFFAAPFFYLAVVYIIWLLWGWVYNLIARHFGGIEFEIKDIDL